MAPHSPRISVKMGAAFRLSRLLSGGIGSYFFPRPDEHPFGREKKTDKPKQLSHHQPTMQNLLQTIIQNPETHARWLNTLSLMENTGAKKIKRCEHPTLTTEMILKHASEESRHAYFLKKQIQKIAPNTCPTYEPRYLLSPKVSFYYLHALDINVCKFLKTQFHYKGNDLKYAAYLLVTYAIEVRADELYPQYQEVLTANKSKVNVKTIIAEEINHLNEMRVQLQLFSPDWKKLCQVVCEIEDLLFKEWIESVKSEVFQ